MDAPHAPVPFETLLAHRAWVRRLATSLVRDESSADDVEQRTWLAAWMHPPADGSTSRAWLGRVVRNQAVNARRGDARRGVHERVAARPEATRPTADVVAEAEAHRRLVDVVMSLAEPYRATVLLRWFEDMPPRDVAARMGVPVETVRTRLRRAHEELRGRLGNRGGAAGCALALGPLVLRPVGTVGGGRTMGGAVMGTKTAWAAAALLAAFAGGVVVRDVAADGSSVDAAKAEVAELRTRLDAIVRPDEARPAMREARGDAVVVRRTVELIERVDAQQSRIDALESALASANARAGTIVAATASRDPATETARLKAMTDDELFGWIGILTSVDLRGVPVDGRAVVDACDLLLARALEPAPRARALERRGIGRRALRDWAAADADFRESLAVAGAATPEGRQASCQLAWNASRRGEPRAAAEAFAALARDEADTPRRRSWRHVYAGTHFDRAGDKDRAAAEFRAVVEQFAASQDTETKKAVDIAREELAKVAGR
jgi:RNA polymerase sigma factor (sigma-70 family)